jgi:hypothetical protein
MILYESSKLIHGRPYINQGPPHISAFCHFKPINLNLTSAKVWDEITNRARLHQSANVKRIPYVSTQVIEPNIPVYSIKEYGEYTGWKR